ncbi:hypothetical protein [Streptomyces sp. SID486]|uniref:hypothetical protein n=1 Tax=Streptomyces sp. SID486 TaxID=2690264 RepID=UPI0031F6CE71
MAADAGAAGTAVAADAGAAVTPTNPGGAAGTPTDAGGPGVTAAIPGRTAVTATNPDRPGVTPTNPDWPGVTPTNPGRPGVTPTNPDWPGVTPTNPGRPGVTAANPGGAAVAPPDAGGCAITADGAYAARLALDGDSWFPERWTLDGPEPYAVPLPGDQPEEPGTGVQPMGDGRVLIHRLVAGRHAFSLLYPTGPGTGELPLGAVECAESGTRLALLPPAPGGSRAYALAVGPRSSVVWLVAGGAFGPERLAEVPGRCSGGVWLDRGGRLLALDRELHGRTKTVVVDLERAGEVSPLLLITDGSDDRLLLADPDSGLLLISSDAPSPGRPRLGWGVLGSTLPVRFPECLRVPECTVTPFAIQPGQVLTPEHCAVALRVDGARGTWVGTWRPAERRVRHLPAPEGWLAGAGLWTQDGVLRLPYATRTTPCGVAVLAVPHPGTGGQGGPSTEHVPAAFVPPASAPPTAVPPASAPPASVPPNSTSATSAPPASVRPASEPVPQAAEPGPATTESEPPAPVAPRPVPLQQAPLGRLVTN